jgi:hypothetical protein
MLAVQRVASPILWGHRGRRVAYAETGLRSTLSRVYTRTTRPWVRARAEHLQLMGDNASGGSVGSWTITITRWVGGEGGGVGEIVISNNGAK